MTATEMPRYQCHKKVWALKIKNLQPGPGGKTMVMTSEENIPTIALDAAYIEKHNPKIGGYYVVYEDGYKSFSPEEAFEDGYTRLP